ncbi:MAG: hypothetical protein IT377_18140 [Polyangiaceae bacterium]|nr:hypothetical protein [Polyangiaceae bacterium]
MRPRAGRTWWALPALALALACQTPRAPRAASPVSPDSGRPAVELRALADRPAISLVHREGDPRGAVAVAIAHDFGSEASLGLASVLGARLTRSGFGDVQLRPHALGVLLSALVASPDDGARFVNAATRALTTPIADTERPRERLRAPALRGPAEAAVQACSGELGLEPAEGGAAPEPPDGAALEAWRGQLATAGSVAFAAVGPRPVLDALAAAVEHGDKWPTSAPPNDRWPESDSVGSVRSAERRLSVAYRAPDSARALDVSQELATPGSVLATRLAALDAGFRLDRVIATTRVRGACLRLDARASSNETTALDVARAASVIDEEARRALEGRTGLPSALDEAVIRPAHPAEAAAAAAWRALVARQPPSALRRAVSWLGPSLGRGSELEQATSTLDAARGKSTVERRVRVEAGQGELWALLASPCGTASESSDDAGVHEVLMRALARKRSGVAGVQIEPWVTPDAVGLLAHSTRANASETPADLARRVGDALGRALVAGRLDGNEVAETKTDLLGEIGPAGQRGYFTLLDSASGGHPSWLDPRGTWRAISTTITSTADARRRVWIGGPLRLAVLANAKSDQGDTAASALERWLRPFRGEPATCPTATRHTPRASEQNVETSRPEQVRAHLAYPVNGPSRDAEWTVHLMNRERGWLEQAVGSNGEVRARASFLGGKSVAAIVIEVIAPEAERGRAVGQVRALIQSLAKGGATEADAEIARRHFDARDAERALDPRGRVVDAWRGVPAPRADLPSLRRFHQQLGAAQEIAVHARLKE